MANYVSTLVKATGRTLAISFPTVLESFVGRVERKVCDTRLETWSKKLLSDVGVELEIRGREYLDLSGPTIVMSNHQSLYDIPVLFLVVPPSLRMVAKESIFRFPIWGEAMRASGFIAIDRKNRVKALKSLALAREKLESGVTVWIAPEGTRTRDGKLLPFKKGGFILAEEMGVPILPITISGTRDILPAKKKTLNYGVKVTVTVHPKVRLEDAPAGVTGQAHREWLMIQVRRAIGSALPSEEAAQDRVTV